MNNNYMSYKNYVESTDYYKSLCEAIQLANELVDNLTNLIQALGKDNGDIITSAIEELEYFKKGAGYLSEKYTAAKEKILSNADSYDTKFNYFKSSVGKIVSSITTVNEKTEERVKAVNIDASTGYIRVEKEITISPKLNYTYDPITKKYYLAPKDSFTFALSSILGKSVSEKHKKIELYNLSGKVS